MTMFFFGLATLNPGSTPFLVSRFSIDRLFLGTAYKIGPNSSDNVDGADVF